MKDMIQFGNRIRQLRQLRNYSLRELGALSGVSYSFINSIENNRFHPSRETVIALADALSAPDKDELLLLAGFAPTEGVDSAEAVSSSVPAESQGRLEGNEVDDPEISLFFKDFKSAPKERRDEMLRFWQFIKENEQARKPGSEQ
ncbi:helix-turn-helix domain-containing protein [Paenibacillus aestuarii]|uniref:Helix-turn-helix domain-containing protein n=1 Tax=Paenibacillus aestuarii TaxID=516965 RepID=A0ABW0KD10_9BACL|nr:helix-turn-helix transcriptional regulator [Paenibacillus aestuarii]